MSSFSDLLDFASSSATRLDDDVMGKRTREKQANLDQKNLSLGINKPVPQNLLDTYEKVKISQYSRDNADADNLTIDKGSSKRIGTPLQGFSVGAWETAKPDSWFSDKKSGADRVKQMNDQALKLDRMRGVDWGTSTWEDVNLMGEYAKEQKNKFLDRNNGIVDPNNPDAPTKQVNDAFFKPMDVEDRSGGNRSIGTAFNSQGDNVGLNVLQDDFLNPEFFGRFNKKGRERIREGEEAQDKEADRKSLFSDSSINESTTAAWINRGIQFLSGANELGGMVVAGAASNVNDDLSDIPDKAKVTFSNINKKRQNIIERDYGSLANYNKIEDKDSLNKVIDGKLLKDLDKNELNLLKGLGEYSTTQDKEASKKRKEGTFNSHATSLAKERLVKPITDLVIPKENKPLEGKEKKEFDSKSIIGKTWDNLKNVVSTGISDLTTPNKVVAGAVRSVVDAIGSIGDEKSKSKGFKPSEVGKYFTKLKSQKDMDTAFTAIGHGLPIGLKEWANNANINEVRDDLKKNNLNTRFELLKYEKSDKTLKDKARIAGAGLSIIAKDIYAASSNGGAMLDVIAGSLPEMIGIIASGGTLAVPMYMQSVNKGKIAYKKNHNNRDAEGVDLLKIHGASTAATALRVGASEFALGKVAGAFGKSTPLSKGFIKAFKEQGLPLTGTGKVTGREFRSQGKVFDAKEKELNGLLAGSEKSLLKHESNLIKVNESLSRTSGIKNKESLLKKKDKLTNLIGVNKKGINELKNKIDLNTNANKAVNRKAGKVDNNQSTVDTLTASSNSLGKQIKVQKDKLKKETLRQSAKGSISIKDSNLLSSQKIALQNLVVKQKKAKAQLAKAQEIKPKLAEAVSGSRTKSDIPVFTNNGLKISFGKKGFNELSTVAKIMDTTPSKLVNAVGRASLALSAAGIVEYGEEAGEELLNQLRDSIGTDKTLDFNKIRLSGALGFSAGVGLGSISTVKNHGKEIVTQGASTALKGGVVGLKAAGAVALGTVKVANYVAVKPAVAGVKGIFPKFGSKVENVTSKVGNVVEGTKGVFNKAKDSTLNAVDKTKEVVSEQVDTYKKVFPKQDSTTESTTTTATTDTGAEVTVTNQSKENSTNNTVDNPTRNTSNKLSQLQVKEGETSTVDLTTYKDNDAKTNKVLLDNTLTPIDTDNIVSNESNAVTNTVVLNKSTNIETSITSNDLELTKTHLSKINDNVRVLANNKSIPKEVIEKSIENMNKLESKVVELTNSNITNNSDNSFSDVDVNNTTETLFSLDAKSEESRTSVKESLDTVLAKNPDNEVAKTGKVLSDVMDKGFNQDTSTGVFGKLLSSITNAGKGQSIEVNNTDQYTAMQSMQEALSDRNSFSSSSTKSVLSEGIKTHQKELNKIDSFIKEGDTNTSLEFEGNQYTIGDNIEDLRDSVTKELEFIDSVNSYFNAVSDSKGDTKDTVNEGRTEFTVGTELNIKSGETTASLLEEQDRLIQSQDKSDTTLADLTAIEEELNIRHTIRNTNNNGVYDASNTSTKQIENDIEKLEKRDRLGENAKNKLKGLKEELNIRNGTSNTEKETNDSTETNEEDVSDISNEAIVVSSSLTKESTKGFNKANKIITNGSVGSTSDSILKDNPNSTNSTEYSESDVVAIHLPEDSSKISKQDIASTVSSVGKVIEAGASIVNIKSMNNKEAKAEITQLLKDSGYKLNTKTGVYSFYKKSFKGTLANNVNGIEATASDATIKAETKSFKERGVKTGVDAANWAIDLAPDNITKTLMTAVRNKLVNSGLKVEVETGTSLTDTNNVVRSPKGNVSFIKNGKGEVVGIKMFINSKTGRYKSVAHELIHAGTVAALYSKNNAKNFKKITNLLKSIRKDEVVASLGKIYGLSNEAEFLAELSNPEFRVLLDKVKIKQKKKDKEGKGAFLSALDVVKAVFKDALGSIIGKDYTALDQGIQILDELLDGELSLEANNLVNNGKTGNSNNKKTLLSFKEINFKDGNVDPAYTEGVNLHRTNRFKVNSGYLLNLAKSTFSSKFLVNKKTKFIGKESNPLRNNLLPHKNRLGSIFSLLPKGIRNLGGIEAIFEFKKADGNTEVNELGYLKDVADYVREFENTLNELLPDLTDIKGEKLAKILKEAPILGFYTGTERGEMDVTIKDAMAMAGRIWLSEDGVDMLHNDGVAIHSLLGNSSNKSIEPDPEVVKLLENVGTLQKDAVERIGNIFIAMMPLEATKNADGALIQKIKNSAALYVLAAMKKRGEIEFSEESNSTLDPFRDVKSDNPNAKVQFVSPVSVNRKNNDTNTTSKGLSKSVNDNKNQDSLHRHMRAGVFGVEAKLQMPSDKPITNKDIEEANNLSFTKISRSMKKGILKAGQIPYLLNNTTHSLTERLGRSFIEEMLKGDRTKLGHAFHSNSVKGKDLDITNNLDNLETWLKGRKEGGIDAYNKPIFILHRVWNNIRMGITDNGINFQASKFHRYMFGAKDWYYSFSLNGTESVAYTDNNGVQQNILMASVATRNILKALGFNVNYNNSLTVMSTIVSEDGKIVTKDKDLKMAIKAINSEGTISSEAKSAIQRVITKAGNKTESLNALSNLAMYQKALTGDGKIKNMMLPTAMDGITNGTAITMSQLPFSVEKAKNILRATGQFFEGDIWTNAEEFLSDPKNLDNYESLASIATSVMDMQNSVSTSKTGNEEVSFDISEFAALNGIIMPTMLKDDGSVSSEGRDFIKEFLMTYIYSKGDKARVEDIKGIAVANIYFKLSEIEEQLSEGILSSDIFSDKSSKAYTKGKKKLKKLNKAINGVRKQAMVHKRSLANELNKLQLQARRANSKNQPREAQRIEQFIVQVMLDNVHLMPRDSKNITARSNIKDNIKSLIGDVKKETNTKIEDIFVIGEIRSHLPLTQQFMPTEVSQLISNLTGKVYGSAINAALEEKLGDFEHSRSLINTSLNYASQVSYMIYSARIDLAKKNKAIEQGLHPDTDVNLSRKEVRAILIDMAKTGKLHTIKHASSNKDINEHVDSLLILSEKLVTQRGSEAKVSIPLSDNKITRKTGSAIAKDPKNKDRKGYTQYSTMNANVSNYEFDPDISVKGSVNMTHAFDGNVQGAMMETGLQMNNNHDSIITGAAQAPQAEADYNQKLHEQNTSYSMIDEVEATVLRAYSNFSKFKRIAGKDNKYLKAFEKRAFKGSKALKVPALYSEDSGAYTGDTVSMFQGKGKEIILKSKFSNGLEVVSAMSAEASHIRTNKEIIDKSYAHINQYADGGFSYKVTDTTQLQDNIEFSKVQLRKIKADLINNMTKEDKVMLLKDDFRDSFDDPDFDVDTHVSKTNFGNTINSKLSDSVDTSAFANVGNVNLSVDVLNTTVSRLGKIDVKNNIEVSSSHNSTLDNFFNTTGKDLLSLTSQVNAKILASDSNNSKVLKGTIYVNTGNSINNSNQPIGAKEALAHGMSSIAWRVLRREDRNVNNKLFRLFNTVTNGKDAITYKDFLRLPESESSDLDIKSAKDFYNNVFKLKNIEAFAAFATTNEMMIEAVSRFKVPEVLVNDKDGTLPNYLQRTFAQSYNTLFSEDINADQYLIDLASNINRVNDVGIIESMGIDGLGTKINSVFGKFVVDDVYRPYSKWINGLNEDHKDKFKLTDEDKSFNDKSIVETAAKVPIYLFKATGKTLLTTATILGSIEDIPRFGLVIQEMLNGHSNVVSNVVNDLITEIRGAKTIERDVYKLLRHVKYFNEGASARAKSGFVKQYESMFDTNNIPSMKDQESFTNVLLRTDAQAVNDLINLEEALKDESKLKEIKSTLEKELERISGKNYNYYKFHTDNLSSYMNDRTFSTYGLMKNANHIANLRSVTNINIKRKAQKFSKDELVQVEEVINKLVTINALVLAPKNDKKVTAKFLKSERTKKGKSQNALDFLMYTHRILQEEKQSSEQADNSRSRIPKGFLHETKSSNVDIKVVEVGGKESIAIKNDYLLQSTFKVGDKNIGVYYNKSSNSQQYQTGIMSITNRKDNNYDIAVGHLINKPTEFNKNYNSRANKENSTLLLGSGLVEYSKDTTMMSPEYNLSDIEDTPSYDFVVGLGETGAVNAFNNNAGSVIGNTLGNNITKVEAPKANASLVRLISRDFKQNYKEEPEQFIVLNSKSINVKHKESFERVPHEMKLALTKKFGTKKPIYVRRSVFNTYFGFSKMSVTKGSLLSAAKDSSVGKKLALHGERIWQAVVAKSKTNSIIYNPKMLFSNTFSNAIALSMSGVPVNSIFSYEKEALTSAIRYRTILKQQADLERKVKAFKSYPKRDADVRRIKNLVVEIRSNNVHDIVSDGLLQSVVEDVVVSESPLISAVDEAIGAFTPSGKGYINDTVDKVTSSNSFNMAISPVSVIKNVIITDDTGIASALRDATQYSDFIARYALIKHRVKEGVSKKEAIEEALDTFIDYDIQTNPLIQYTNDMGLIMYTKFFFRIQRVIARQMANAPASSLAGILAQLAIADVPDITDSNLSHGAYMPSPSSTIDNAFGLNLLKFIPFF